MLNYQSNNQNNDNKNANETLDYQNYVLLLGGSGKKLPGECMMPVS
jgi:hypothetical protein